MRVTEYSQWREDPGKVTKAAPCLASSASSRETSVAEVERASRENGSGWSLGVMERRAECMAGRHSFRDFYSEGSRGYLQVWAEEKQYPPYLEEELLWLPYGEPTSPRGEAGRLAGALVIALR